MLRNALTVLGLLGLLFIAWSMYSPGFSSTQQFDDAPNLDGLSHIESSLDALNFVFDGKAGPLGRPLALATFAFQRAHWPGNLDPLFRTNVFLHLMTGVMVFVLAAGLARAARIPNPSLVAFLACALWILSPFLATAQLTLIQRMTTLAGLWVFFGLALYVWGRILEPDRPFAGLSVMAVGIVIGSLLGALSKENAALLPLLALITEITLLNRNLQSGPRAIVAARWFLLILPSVALLAYIGMRVPSLLDPASHREYTPLQRFASQPQILWEYVRHLLLPTTNSVTPFSDDRSAALGWFTSPVLASTLSWFVVAVAVFFLRHRAPLLLFGTAFFLVGHLLESGIIHLELYYPHRNYVPAFGLYFVLAALAGYATLRGLRVLVTASIAYVVAFAMVLASTTTLWGQPLLAAEIWAQQHPESNRANQFLARAYYSIGDNATAHRVLQRGASVDRSGGSALQALHTCEFHKEPGPEVAEHVSTAIESVRRGVRDNGIGTIVLSVTVRTLEGHCPYLTPQLLREIIDSVLLNPHYERSRPIRAQLANARALIALSEGDIETYSAHVKEMYGITKHINHARFYARVLVAGGERDAAISFLEEARQDERSSLARRWVIHRMIDEEITLIRQAQTPVSSYYSGHSL